MATLFESYDTGGFGTGFTVWGSRWRAQTFTPATAHTITSVKLAVGRKGSPGTMTVSIRATDVNGRPTGPDLASGSLDANTFPATPPAAVEWKEFSFGAGTPLTAGTKYAMVVRCPSGDADTNYGRWEVDNGGTPYSGGEVELSSDSGASWTEYGAGDFDFFFEDWGDEIVAATVTTDAATGIDVAAATLNGTLDDDGGEACDCGFEWGETEAYGNTTPTQSRTTGQTFAQTISGLDSGTTYHFRAVATNTAGTSNGPDRTFETPLALPTVTTDPATALSAIAATLNGTLDDEGEEACDCGFEWGLDTGYGTTTPTESKTTGETFSQVIGGLSPGTTYHFRALASNPVGTDDGADRSFATALVISKGYALGREEL